MLRPLIFLLALSALPCGQDISKAQSEETKIIALENLWNQLQINHEADATGKMLDSDFALSNSDRSVMSKTPFLTPVRDKSTQLAFDVSDDMRRYRHGDTAVVTGATREKGNPERDTVFASRPLHEQGYQETRPMTPRRQSAEPHRQVRAILGAELTEPLIRNRSEPPASTSTID
jgi:hypothetical protein